jgi:hypothetical protein
MEFVQFHPTGMVWPPSVKGILVTESVRGDGGVLKNSEGKRFMFDYIPDVFRKETRRPRRRPTAGTTDKKNNRRPPELLPRDEVARAINSEVKAGRGTEHGGVFLDIASRRRRVHPQAAAVDVPPVQGAGRRRHHQEPMEVGPTCHYVMGGVEVDPDTAATPCPGCSPPARWPAACTAPTGSAATRCPTCWSSAAAPARRAYARALAPARPACPTDDEDDEAAARRRWRRSSGRAGEPVHDPAGPAADDARPGRHHPHARRRWSRRSERIEKLKERAANLVGRGHRQYNPGWHLALDLRNMLLVSSASRGRARAAGEPRRAHPRRLPGDDPEWGKPGLLNLVCTRGQLATPPAAADAASARCSSREAAAADAGRAGLEIFEERARPTATTLKIRVWRGDADGGELRGLHRRGQRGRGRPRRHPPAAGHPGRRPRRPLELQGRQVRLVQRRDQRPAAADVHDPDEHFERGRDDHGHAAAHLPGHPRPGHRRLVQLREGREIPAFAPPPRPDADGKYRMQQVDVERSQEFRKCIECFLCQNTCHVIRDHEENKPAFAGPRFFIRLRRARHAPARHRRPAQARAGGAGLGYCNITKCCTEVCPEGIHITDNAIIPMKERVSTASTTR